MYAEQTTVSVEKSRAEIERLLTKYGASRFVSGWDQRGATIAFEVSSRMVRFQLPMPNLEDFAVSSGGRRRHNEKAKVQACEQEQRRRWRALALVIKAKLEAVETKIVTFEDEFLAHIVLPNNTTVAEWIGPQLMKAFESKKMPPLLAAGP